MIEMQTKLTKLEDTSSSTTATIATFLQHVHSCDESWTLSNGHCYLVVDEQKSWDDASAYCENISSYLVEVTTDAEREFAAKLLRDYTNDGSYKFWIGVTDRDTEGRFLYQHDQQLVPGNYWYEGEPNDYGAGEDCAHMSRYIGVLNLNDIPCGHKRRFVCEKP